MRGVVAAAVPLTALVVSLSGRVKGQFDDGRPCAPSASPARSATRPWTTRSPPASAAGSTAGPTATSTSARSSPWPPNLKPFADAARGRRGHGEARCCRAGGRASYDAELIHDGKAFRPDGKTAATLIPPPSASPA